MRAFELTPWRALTVVALLVACADGGDTEDTEDTEPAPDTTPPETTLDAAPSGTVTTRDATITFSGTDDAAGGVVFACSVDDGAFGACSSPHALTALLDGAHTFEVRAVDAAGNEDATPASASWTVDATPPDTAIDSGPAALVASADAAFTLSTTASDAVGFECDLDGAGFAACDASTSYTGLASAAHTLSVRAKDAAGNVDATPATWAWTVDLVPPDTTVSGGPAALTNSASAAFTLSSTDDDVDHYECSLDGAAFATCATPSYTGLADGDHTFEARAIDRVGNVDASAAAHAWTVDTTPPDTSIDTGPTALTTLTTASFGVSSPASDLDGYACDLDGAGYADCPSPLTLSGLDDGAHTLSVRARDLAGNDDPTPDSWTWTVDTLPPSTRITQGPDPVVRDTQVAFTFASPHDDVTGFECSVDGGAFAACAASATLTAAAVGEHTLDVRAVDAAGNRDASPVSASWIRATGEWRTAAVGEIHACGIATDRSLWCWGRGLLGDGVDHPITVDPVRESLGRTDWSQVATGSNGTCAITTGGALYCWGDDTYGQLGDGGTNTASASPKRVDDATDWKQVSLGRSYVCAVKTGGALYCWGWDIYRTLGAGPDNAGDRAAPQQVAGTGWASVEAGLAHACAITTDGSMSCWGNNTYGQAGGPAGEIQDLPVAIPGAWDDVALGSSYTTAIKKSGADRTVWTWGSNVGGVLGTNTPANLDPHETPVQEVSGATDWSALSATWGSTCAIRAGQLWCWGYGIFYGLGDRLVPTRVGADSDWAAVPQTQNLTAQLALRSDGTLWVWGLNTDARLNTGRGVAWEPVQQGQHHADWESVEGGGDATCAIRDGQRWCWGANLGQLGLGSGMAVVLDPTAVTLGLGPLAALSLGDRHSCAIVAADGGLHCTGNNTWGQLGDGSTTTVLSPVQEVTLGAWTEVVAAPQHTLAIADDGSLWGWGNASSGRIGFGDPFGDIVRKTPLPVGTATDWVAMAGAAATSCGIRDDGLGGDLYCWGRDGDGQRGDGPTDISTYVPTTPLAGSVDWLDVRAGLDTFCGLDAAGTVRCWGKNDAGQAAVASSADTTAPNVLALDPVAKVALRERGGCALTDVGELWCWGDDALGAVGAGDGDPAFAPVQVGDDTWVDVAAGADHVCGLRDDGVERTLWCWGLDISGQLGIGGAIVRQPSMARDP